MSRKGSMRKRVGARDRVAAAICVRRDTAHVREACESGLKVGLAAECYGSATAGAEKTRW